MVHDAVRLRREHDAGPIGLAVVGGMSHGADVFPPTRLRLSFTHNSGQQNEIDRSVTIPKPAVFRCTPYEKHGSDGSSRVQPPTPVIDIAAWIASSLGFSHSYILRESVRDPSLTWYGRMGKRQAFRHGMNPTTHSTTHRQ